MSKAEEEANKRYCITRGDDTEETSGIDMQRASDFIDGYQQAEKDLELTWEDIEKIVDLYDDVYCDFSIDGKGGKINAEEHYQEVLKRFLKEMKEKCQ